jgi:hypothetical protein
MRSLLAQEQADRTCCLAIVAFTQIHIKYCDFLQSKLITDFRTINAVGEVVEEKSFFLSQRNGFCAIYGTLLAEEVRGERNP